MAAGMTNGEMEKAVEATSIEMGRQRLLSNQSFSRCAISKRRFRRSFREICSQVSPNPSGSNLVPPSTVLEYSLGEEGDLFKAPEPIIEEPAVTFDPIASAISMISCGEDVISTESMNITDMGSMQNDFSLLSEVFYECKKDLLENSAIIEPFLEVHLTVRSIQMEDDSNLEKNMLVSQGSIYKSVSSGWLSSMESISGNAARPNFLDFQGVDFRTAYGMRRAYSEGDMQIFRWSGCIKRSFDGSAT